MPAKAKPAPAEPRRQARWQSANLKARWAHIALASGVRRGLVKREPCEDCGAEEVDRHHENNNEPLRVVWLCRRHHVQLHSKARRA